MIAKVLDSFTQQNENLIRKLNDILYWYRGALSRNDLYFMTNVEIEICIEFINKRFKEAGKLLEAKISPGL